MWRLLRSTIYPVATRVKKNNVPREIAFCAGCNGKKNPAGAKKISIVILQVIRKGNRTAKYSTFATAAPKLWKAQKGVLVLQSQPRWEPSLPDIQVLCTKKKKNVRATSRIWSGPKVYWRLISWVCGKPLRVEPIKDCKRRWKPHLRIYSERHNLRAKQGGVALVAGHFFVTENSLLNYHTTLCNCILPYVVVFVIVIVLYKYICFDLRATVGCFVASNLASLPQRLFLNAHVWDSRYIKTYPSHSARELSDPGGVRVSLMSSFKSICW